jgi:hypothetical protein
VAKQSSTDPFSLGHKPIVDIEDDRWRQIEITYGSALSPSVRAGIIQATNSYLFLRRVEAAPERMAKVKIVLESHDKAASRFFNELFTGPSVTSEAGAYAHYLIENNFKSSQTSVTELGLDGLLDGLRAFHIACNASIKQLSDPKSSSDTRKGDAWRIWINQLAENISEVEWKDKGKRAKQLPSLVWELQNYLPRECRYDAHSKAALAEVISEALAPK